MATTRLLPPARQRQWLEYAVGVVASIVAVILRRIFDGALGNAYPFIFAFGAIALTAAYGGWRPAVLAIVVSYLAADWFFVDPRGAFDPLHGRELVALAAYLFTSAVITAMASMMRRAERRARNIGEALAAEREQWRVTLSSIGDAVVATDDTGAVTFLNPTAEKLSGWKNAEARGRTIEEVLPLFNEVTGEPTRNPIARALTEQVVVAMANRTVLRPRSGADIPIEDSAAPILMPDGSLKGGIIVFHDVTEKRERERALRDAAWLARTALEVGKAAAWIWEIDRGVASGDQLFATMVDLPLERLRTGVPIQTFFKAIHGEDRTRVEGAMRQALESGEPYHEEFRIATEDGYERWVEAHGRAESEVEGQVRRMPGVLVDITARRAAEAQLHASGIRSKAIIDTSLDAVLLMNARGLITDWNPAAERIFGWTRSEVFETELADRIIPQQLREAHRKGLAHFMASGEGPVLARRLELTALRKDGTEFPVELSINLLPADGDGMFVGFIRDLSQRRAAEAELDVRAKLAALRADISAMLSSPLELDLSLHRACELLVRHLEASFARIWVLDPAEGMLVLRASAGLYSHLDGTHARIPVGQFKIGRIAESRRAHLTNDVANDPNISSPEWARREGMVAFAGYPLIVNSRLIGVMALFSQQALSEAVLGDLAPIADTVATSIERRVGEAALRAEKDRAEAASQAKDNFLAALSHELRTPLTPVLMMATSLRDDERLPEEVRADLAMIERNIGLEARLIDDLLDLTRVAQGKLPIREEICDAHSLLGLAVEIVRDEAHEKPVSLHLDLSARRTELRADPARLQQVFWNLLRNAIKFTPAGGRISIRSRDETDGRLRIEVSDTGIGLPAEALQTVFKPFEQAGRENSHQFGGLGLGLAIVRAIIHLHGGEIIAQSDGIGKGCTFIVELPGASEQSAGISADTGTGKPGENSSDKDDAPLRLLVVEDHEPTLTVLRRLLSRAGHQIITANSVASAVAAATGSIPLDFVISDLGLPDGTGLELMARLQALQPGLRGIALSGYGMEEDLRRSYESGFEIHLVKPVDFRQLNRALRELVAARE